MEDIFERVAVSNGVTPQEVEREILFAMDCARSRDDPETRAFWERLSADGKNPSPAELVALLAAALIRG